MTGAGLHPNFTCASAFPRRDAPELCGNLGAIRKTEGAQGKPGARCTRSLACKVKIAHELVTTGSPEQSGLPCAMVLTVSFALPGDEFLLSPSSADYGLAEARSGRRHLRKLDTSNGCQDHTTLPSAKAPFVRAPAERSRARLDPPCDGRLRARRCRVHRIPCPTSVTIAMRPSVGRNGGAYGFDLGQAETGKFLETGLDR
jgi:hypothetical protein